MKNSLRSKNLPLVATGIPAPFCNPKTKTTSNLKGFLTLVVMVMGMQMGWGQTAYNMSLGNKTWDFTGTWVVSSGTYTGTDAGNWASVGIIGTGSSVTTGLRTTKSSATIASGTTGGFQKPSGTIQFLSTGSNATAEAVAIDLLLNFTGRTAGTLSFDWAAIDNTGTRPTSLRVFWSTDGTTFTEIAGAQLLDKESATSPASGTVSTIALPSNFDGSSTARLRFYNHAGTTATGTGTRDKFQMDNIAITSTAAAATPTITSTGSLSAVNTTYGTASATPTSFTVSGANMSAGISVNPPAGFQVSTASDFLSNTGTNGSPITVGASGTITATSVYVRLLGTATVAGSPYTGNIVLSSTSATSVNVATASSTVATKGLTITGLTGSSKNYDGNTSASFTGTAEYNGLANGQNFSVTGTPTAVFSDAAVGTGKAITISGYTAPSTNYSLTQPTLSGAIIAVVSGAPTIGAASAGNGQANVAFSAPSFTGGASITGYTVTSSPDGITTSGATSPIAITGLTNGTAYTFSVVATNSVGNSTSSSASNSVTPSSGPTVPDAPVIGSATSGNTQVSIAFTAPASDGGSAIIGYTVTSSPGDFTGTGASSPIVVTGLTNGTPYTFTITANNSVGNSVSSNASNSVTPATTPSAPTISGITAGNAQLTVAFSAGATGGSAITNYKYSTDNGATFTACSTPQTTSPIVIIGLTNGTTYSVQIKAVNSVGDGTACSSTNGTPATTPSAPTITGITSGDTQLTVAFTAGVTGGSAITNYKYSTNGGATFTALSSPSTASPIVITGLTNGTSYNIQIRAVNAIGDGTATASTSGTPATTPSAPTITGITAGDSQLSVAFTAGATGGSAITNYKYSTNGGTTFTALSTPTTASPIVITGLTNGTAYAVQIKAVNSMGDGLATASSTGTPALPPVSLVTFDFASILGTETTVNSNTNNANMAVSAISRGAGLTSSANADRYNATNWAITSIANAVSGNNYVEFTLAPNSGYMFSVSSILFQLQRSGTGLTAIALRSSVDNYATNLDAEKSVVDNTNTQSFTFTFTQINSLLPIIYRLYGYAEATTGTGGPGDGTGNDIVITGTVSIPATPPTLTADASSNTVDNNIDITFTEDATWRSKITAVKVGTTALTVTTDYVITAGNIQLKPSGLNALLTASGSKSVTVVATGYTDAAVTQAINAGVPTANSTATISAILAPGTTKTITGTAKDQYNNLVSGYAFKYEATVSNVTATTTESYTIDGSSVPTTATNVITGTTNSSGMATFDIAIPATIDIADGISVQVKLADGTTNVGAAFAYYELPGQTITFSTLSAVTYGDAAFTVSATGGESGNPVVFTSSDPLVASCSGTNGATITILKTGTTTISANQAGNSGYNAAAQVNQLLTINTKGLTITGLTGVNKVYNGNTTATFTGAPTYDGLVYGQTFTVTETPTANFADANVGAAKTITIAGYTSPSANYTLTQPTLTADITQASQTISFGSLPNRVLGGASFTLTQNASSTLAINYVSSDTDVATISGNTVTIVGVGTTTITASQAGNTNYAAATTLFQSQTILPVPIAGWDFTGVGSYATFAATTFAANLVSASGANNIKRGSTAPFNAVANAFSTAGFQNNGISTANTDYFQVTLSAATNYQTSLSAINANFDGTSTFYATPGVTSQYAYSLDGTNFTLIGSPITSTLLKPVAIDLSGITALQNVSAGTIITIRYYASGQTTTGGWRFYSPSAGVNGLAIQGAVTCVPPTITLGFFDDVSPNATSFSIPYTNTTGSPDQYSITTASTNETSVSMPGFTPVSNTTLPNSPISVLIPASAPAEYGFNLTITNTTTGCSSVTPFQFHVTALSHGVIGSNQTICSGTASAALTNETSASGVGTITYTWEKSIVGLSSGYSAIDGVTTATYAPGILTQTTYFKRVAHNTAGEVSDSDPVTITVSTTPAPSATAQSFCNSGTVADLQAIGDSLKWYAEATGGSVLASNSSLTSGNYFVSSTINTCESIKTEVAINVVLAPESSSQTFCTADPVVDDLVATGTNLKWYLAATGGESLDPITPLISGNYYVSQTVNDCETNRTEVAITINTAPVAIAQSFCISTDPKVSDLLATGMALKWYSAATGGDSLNLITPLISNNYYVSQTINECESLRTEVAITVDTPTSIGDLTPSLTTICSGSSTTLSLGTSTGSVNWFRSSNYENSTSTPVTWTSVPISATVTSTSLNTGIWVYSSTFPIKWYKAVATNGACASTSNIVSVVISPPVKVRTITASPATICTGSGTTLTLASGSAGSIQWQKSTSETGEFVNVGSVISATTSTNALVTISTGALTQDTWYRIKFTNGVCEAYSTLVKVTVSPASTIGTLTTALATICTGSSTTLTLGASTGTVTWFKSTNYVGATGIGTWTLVPLSPIVSETSLTTGSLIYSSTKPTTWYKAIAKNGVCTSTSNIVSVTVSPAAKATIVSGNSGYNKSSTAICLTETRLLTLASGSVGAIQWQYYNAGSNSFVISNISLPDSSWTSIIGETGVTYNASSTSIGNVWFRVKLTSNPCSASAYSTPVNIWYKSCPTPSVVKNSVEFIQPHELKATLPFDCSVYPNPYTSTFQLNLISNNDNKISIRIYDNIGKLIEMKEIELNEIKHYEIGTNYSAGVYNIIITQGVNVKSIRVIKK